MVRGGLRRRAGLECGRDPVDRRAARHADQRLVDAERVGACDVGADVVRGADAAHRVEQRVRDRGGRRLALAGRPEAGNMLAGAQVLEETARAFKASKKPFAERLIEAMEAGEAAGGDKRGKQSAALLVYTGEQYANLNLRVDDHAEPLAELRRLYDKAHERFVPYLMCSPSKARPWGVLDRALIEQEIAAYKRPSS